MAVHLDVHIDADLVGAHFANLVAKASDLSPLMGTIGNILEASTKDRLRDTNTSPDGAAWPPSMRAREDGGKTLFASGQLAASIHNVPGAQEVEIGTNLIYAGIHQSGGTIVPKFAKSLAFALPGGEFAVVGSVTIPARPYLGVSDEDRSDIGDAVALYFQDEPVQ